MHGDALLIALVMLVGCAAFLFGVLYMIFRGFGWVGRGIAGMFRSAPVEAPRESPGDARQRPGCPCSECGRFEDRAGARYCSQCGARLRPIPYVESV